MLCFEISLNEAAKAACFRCLRLLRLGNGTDRFALSKELRRTDWELLNVDFVARSAVVTTRLSMPVLENLEPFDAYLGH